MTVTETTTTSAGTTETAFFTLTVAELKAFKAVVSAAKLAKCQLPVLSSVLYTSGRLCVSDLDITITVDVHGSELGRFLVPMKALWDAAKGKASDVVRVSYVADGSACSGTVTIGGMTLRTDPHDEYPTLGRSGIRGTYCPPIAELAAVLPAVSRDWARPILCGVYVADGSVVGCDSYRLEWVDTTTSHADKLLIPWNAVAALDKAATTIGTQVGDLELSGESYRQAGTWRGDRWSITTRLIEGEYPNWRNLIPDHVNYGWRIEVNAAAIVAALKECRQFVGKNSSTPVRLAIIAKEALELSAHVQDVGDWVAILDTELCDGPEFAATFNPGYLATACRGDGTVIITGIDALKPAIVTSHGEATTRLLMPVRVS